MTLSQTIQNVINSLPEHFTNFVVKAFSGFCIGALFDLSEKLSGAGVVDWHLVIYGAFTGGLYYAVQVGLAYLESVTTLPVPLPTPVAPVVAPVPVTGANTTLSAPVLAAPPTTLAPAAAPKKSLVSRML